MTTTLRPTGPEQRTPGGNRSRPYEVCVNGRPVGTIEIAAEVRYGATVGRIPGLQIDEADRRRGRATVAALAAEEVLRGWGCRQVEVAVRGDSPEGLRFAGAMGYVLRNRNMVKELPAEAPELPGSSVGRPMTEAEFAVWKVDSLEDYAQDWITRGMPAAEARAKAEAGQLSGLPNGLASPGAQLSVLTHQGEAVGILWLALRVDGAYIYDVEVDAEHRGQGHGRSLMLLAEGQALAAGASRLGLNVFAGNTPAEQLYESLGYRTTMHHLYKSLL